MQYHKKGNQNKLMVEVPAGNARTKSTFFFLLIHSPNYYYYLRSEKGER